jgi:hypothetical protein
MATFTEEQQKEHRNASGHLFDNVPFEAIEIPGGRGLLVCANCEAEVQESDEKCENCGLEW